MITNPGYRHVSVYLLEEDRRKTILASGIRVPDSYGYSIYNIFTNQYIYSPTSDGIAPQIMKDVPGISYLEIEVHHDLPKNSGPYS